MSEDYILGANKYWPIVHKDKYPDPPKKEIICNNCGERGHMRYKCRNTPKPKTCYMCGLEGHQEVRCPNTLCLKVSYFRFSWYSLKLPKTSYAFAVWRKDEKFPTRMPIVFPRAKHDLPSVRGARPRTEKLSGQVATVPFDGKYICLSWLGFSFCDSGARRQYLRRLRSICLPYFRVRRRRPFHFRMKEGSFTFYREKCCCQR